MPPTERLWIATAPAGVPSSGPSVIYDEGTADPILDQYREMGWEVVGPYALEPEPPRIISGRTQAEVNDQHTRRLAALVERSHERMRRAPLDRTPFDHRDPSSGYPGEGEPPPLRPEGWTDEMRDLWEAGNAYQQSLRELSKEPPDASFTERIRRIGEGDGDWPHGAPGRFPEPSQAQVEEAERKLSEAERACVFDCEHRGGPHACLCRWEAEGGALPREP